jgi:hypothetical protein
LVGSLSRSDVVVAVKPRVMLAALAVALVELMSISRPMVSPGTTLAAPVAESLVGPTAIAIVPELMVCGPAAAVSVNWANAPPKPRDRAPPTSAVEAKSFLAMRRRRLAFVIYLSLSFVGSGEGPFVGNGDGGVLVRGPSASFSDVSQAESRHAPDRPLGAQRRRALSVSRALLAGAKPPLGVTLVVELVRALSNGLRSPVGFHRLLGAVRCVLISLDSRRPPS